MADIFTLDQRDLNKLIKFARNAPTHFRRAAAGVLNDQAFLLRKLGIDQIKKTMTIRNPRFVNSVMRVDKARTGSSISSQTAIAGSIRKERFSGWEEQELGKGTQRERIASTVARGGSKRSTVKPRFRMKRGRKFMRPQQIGGPNFNSKIRSMFRIMGTRGGRQLFYLDRKYKRMNPGLYVFNRKGISKIQDTDPKRLQPRRNRWMTKAINRHQRMYDIKKSWEKNIRRNLPKNI